MGTVIVNVDGDRIVVGEHPDGEAALAVTGGDERTRNPFNTAIAAQLRVVRES